MLEALESSQVIMAMVTMTTVNVNGYGDVADGDGDDDDDGDGDGDDDDDGENLGKPGCVSDQPQRHHDGWRLPQDRRDGRGSSKICHLKRYRYKKTAINKHPSQIAFKGCFQGASEGSEGGEGGAAAAAWTSDPEAETRLVLGILILTSSADIVDMNRGNWTLGTLFGLDVLLKSKKSKAEISWYF